MLKKYHTQMTEAEIKKLEEYVSGLTVDDLGFTEHAVDRADYKDITKSDIKKTLARFSIVEYKSYSKEYKRIVIRGKKVRKGMNTVLCIDTDNNLITAWKNPENNKHSRVNLSKYTDNLRVDLSMVG